MKIKSLNEKKKTKSPHEKKKNNKIKLQMNEHGMFQLQALVLAHLHVSYSQFIS